MLIVAAYSIRHRILKDAAFTIVDFETKGCSLFDPTQDTERAAILAAQVNRAALQPIRSDTGY